MKQLDFVPNKLTTEINMTSLTIFTATCGHRWIGLDNGSYACPVCGLHDGDHHLIQMEDLPVQLDDFTGGNSWDNIAKAAKTK
jgi:hypothetical protein